MEGEGKRPLQTRICEKHSVVAPETIDIGMIEWMVLNDQVPPWIFQAILFSFSTSETFDFCWREAYEQLARYAQVAAYADGMYHPAAQD